MGESAVREPRLLFRESRSLFLEEVRVRRDSGAVAVAGGGERRVDLVAGHAGQNRAATALIRRRREIVLSPRAAEESAHQT